MEKIDKKNIEDILALTPMQEGMLFHYLKDPGSDLYLEQLCLEITGTIDFPQFERAWNRVIETNEMLRTVFRWEQVEHPVQIILKQHHLYPGYDDFSDRDVRERKRLLEEVKTRNRKNAGNLVEVPFGIHLCKTGEERYEMIISHHHILYDGWSNGIILKEFFMAYHVLCKGERSIKLPVKTPFKEFIKYIQNQDRKIQEQFWGEYLDGIDTPTALPIKKRRGEVKCLESVSLILAKDIKDKLDVFVNNNRVTLAPVFYTAWGILLQKYCGCADVIFGTTVSGRSAEVKGIEEMVGLFINTIPMRVHSAPGVKIIDVLTGIENLLREREKFESTSLVDIGSYSPAAGSGSLFDTIVAVENYPLGSRLLPEDSWLSVHSYSIVEMTHYDLAVGIMPFNEIEIKFSFKQELFDKETIENLAGHFKGIVRNIIENPESVLFQLEIISIEEKNRILYEFNNTAAEYPGDKTIYRLFEEQADRIPDHIALGGKVNPKFEIRNSKQIRNSNGQNSKPEGTGGLAPLSVHISITYKELNLRSGRLAGWLIEKGVLVDNIVGIMLERSVEMIIGILGILKSGAAYLPIDPNYPGERIDFMLKDSNARVLVTTPKLQVKVKVEKNFKQPLELPLQFVNIETEYATALELSSSTLTLTCQVSPANLAYIIYTSGSTGWPKGVAVEHSQVVNFVFHMYNQYDKDVGVHDRCLGVTNIMFDVSVWECFLPLTFGARLVILPEQERFDVFALVGAIGLERITLIYLPPALLEDVCEQLKKQNRWISLNKMLVGVAPIRDKVLEGYMQLKPGMKIINGYGPTETTICATSYNYLSHEPLGDIVPIGIPLSNLQVILLDPAGHIIPQGIPGEICISGGGVSRGYINNPELTSDKFDLDLKDYRDYHEGYPRSYRSHKSYIIYHTGDLARWLKDGNIEFLGRIDNQVKIRGFRVELGEIEGRLLAHEKVKDVVVVVKTAADADRYLCAYVVAEEEIPVPELRKFLSSRVPDYMIPTYFVFLEKIPITVNGKVDRKALPAPEIKTVKDREGTTAAPRDEIEKKVAALWSEVLKIDKEKIGIDDNFFESGGHSLNAAILLNRVHKAMDIKIPLGVIFETSTIRELSEYIKTNRILMGRRDRCTAIEPVELREYYPLSPAQKQFYITQHTESEGIGYNVQNLVTLEGRLSQQDLERLEKTFGRLVERHENLRTSFFIVNDEPVQGIHDHVEFKMEYYDLSTEDTERKGEIIQNSFVRPFDLSHPPLLRVGLIKTSEEIHIFMIDTHHIAADDLSMSILVREFTALYRGEELAPLKIQYKDFALHQEEMQQNPVEKEAFKRQEAYWLQEFTGDIPVLDLPFDYPRPAIRRYEGASVPFDLDRETAGLLKELALAEDVTPFILLLTVFNVLLAKICDQGDIPVGIPISVRRHADLEPVIGFFTNMLVTRNQPDSCKTFKSFLKEVKKKILAAFENRDYPYEDLVDKLSMKVKRDASRNSLFDVVFVWEDLDIRLDCLSWPGSGPGENSLHLKPYHYEKINAPFDLIFTGTEVDGKMSFFINYSTALFKRETVEKIARGFIEVISGVVKNPGITLEDIAVSYDLLEAAPGVQMEAQGDFGF